MTSRRSFEPEREDIGRRRGRVFVVEDNQSRLVELGQSDIGRHPDIALARVANRAIWVGENHPYACVDLKAELIRRETRIEGRKRPGCLKHQLPENDKKKRFTDCACLWFASEESLLERFRVFDQNQIICHGAALADQRSAVP